MVMVTGGVGGSQVEVSASRKLGAVVNEYKI